MNHQDTKTPRIEDLYLSWCFGVMVVVSVLLLKQRYLKGIWLGSLLDVWRGSPLHRTQQA
jgi:hypothetical protein